MFFVDVLTGSDLHVASILRIRCHQDLHHVVGIDPHCSRVLVGTSKYTGLSAAIEIGQPLHGCRKGDVVESCKMLVNTMCYGLARVWVQQRRNMMKFDVTVLKVIYKDAQLWVEEEVTNCSR